MLKVQQAGVPHRGFCWFSSHPTRRECIWYGVGGWTVARNLLLPWDLPCCRDWCLRHHRSGHPQLPQRPWDTNRNCHCLVTPIRKKGVHLCNKVHCGRETRYFIVTFCVRCIVAFRMRCIITCYLVSCLLFEEREKSNELPA